MKEILVVDDDIQIGNVMEKVLSEEGYAVSRAYSGTEVLLFLKGHRPDLILLDLMLPGFSGEEILPEIRDIPVIVISAKTETDSKVKLLLGGAEDYMTKPFSVMELLARVAVQLRRGKPVPAAGLLRFQEIELDTGKRSVKVGGVSVKLTKTEYAVLKLLMRNPSQVMTRSVLLDEISGDSPGAGESPLGLLCRIPGVPDCSGDFFAGAYGMADGK